MFNVEAEPINTRSEFLLEGCTVWRSHKGWKFQAYFLFELEFFYGVELRKQKFFGTFLKNFKGLDLKFAKNDSKKD